MIHYVKDKFNEVTLPAMHKRNGILCYLDPIRKNLINITTEVKVRQQVISYLTTVLGVPKEMLMVEVPLAPYGSSKLGRADIIIHRLDVEQNILIPVAVVECKANEVYLSETCMRQAFTYADEIGCNYAYVTNGVELVVYYYDEIKESYVALQEIPTYEVLLEGGQTVINTPEPLERSLFEVLSSKEIQAEYMGYDIGGDTPPFMVPLLVNLWECFLDITHTLPRKKCNGYEIIEDYGIRVLDYGNAGGGRFVGPYRSIIIRDDDGECKIVSFSISTYTRTEKTKEGKVWPVKTVIAVAIDGDKQAHHALQLVCDDSIQAIKNTYHFRHSGRINIGNKGSGKIAGLKKLIKEETPQLLQDDQIYLGKITHDRVLYMDDEEMEQLIHSLIDYVLVRDKYRLLYNEKAMIGIIEDNNKEKKELESK
ncbi:MAG: type I restriction enzyme HsdR N-terminal domain-containing protein [Cellulosilyticaceae bacterium]